MKSVGLSPTQDLTKIKMILMGLTHPSLEKPSGEGCLGLLSWGKKGKGPFPLPLHLLLSPSPILPSYPPSHATSIG